MPEQRSATPAVPPPLPGRARTPVPTLVPAVALAPAAAPPAPAPAAAPAVRPAPAPLAAPAPVPPASAPALTAVQAPVPGALPSAEEAEAVLAAALRGEAHPDPDWRAAAERVAAALSEGERTALTSGPLSFDPGLLRGAAGLRLRLDLAVALVPTRPDLHGAALPALLGEVDALLLKVKVAGADAPPGAAEALDPVRLALVDGGVALAGALARVGPAAPAPLPAAPFVSPSRPAPRVLSNLTAAEAARTERSGKGLWVAFAIALAAVGGYHGWQFATRKPPEPTPTLAGAPAHTFVVPDGAGGQLLLVEPGAKVSPAELEAFTEQERAKGNVLRALPSGGWVVEPASQVKEGKP
ncbi:hypothetical protein [Anaeromyxobacter diazotrophicus]|uniref:Uncharacterized protein n=1 Tax=Anaeromyxobacter diazotrophicus TaxID=2590199 RepID=A0A7I9VHT3_9BACT|nr:hypothetical protein [Anaeromyxobacter diazotrophicus]GEJ55587.1 hypothetical protein AMYX_03280 [Anaeromyxobacter diazotrophicus]